MKVDIQEAGPGRKRLEITITNERLQAHVDKVYKSTGEQVQIKGFRPGHVPKNVLRKRFGEQILAEAKESLINETFQEAMKANDLQVIGQPKLNVDDDPLAEDGDFSYSVELELRPEVKVGSVKDIKLMRRATDPTDEEVEQAMHGFAQEKRKLQSVDDELKEGDFAKVDMAYRLDGAELVKKEGLQISAAIPVRGCDAEEFKEKLKGQTPGSSVVMPIEFPDTFETEEARGKTGELDLTVHEVVRFVEPPIDEELAKAFEFDSLEAMRTRVHERIHEQKTASEEDRLFGEIMDQLYAENPFDVPEGLVGDEVAHRIEGFKKEMQQRGMSEEEMKRQVDQGRAEVEESARTGVRNMFLVEALASKEKLFVTESDVDTALKQVATENETTLIEVRKYFEEKNMLPELRMDLRHRKVRDFLKEAAQIADE